MKEGRREGRKERRNEGNGGPKERRNEGTKERRNEGMKERRNEGTKDWKEWWNEWRIEGMKDWMMKEGRKEWMDGWMNEWTWGFAPESVFTRQSSSTSTWIPSVFCDFEVLKANALQCKLSSRYSLGHILPTSSSTWQNILKCKSSSCNSLVQMPALSSQSAVTAPAFWSAKSSSRDCFVRFLWTTLPDRAPKPRKQRPSFGDPGSHITRINTGFHVRQCFNPWIHTFPSCRSSLLLPHANCSCSLCCWHDDDMTVTWWRWWQDCPWTFVGNLDFFELNFLWLNYIYYYKWMLSPSSNRFRGKWNPDDDKIWIKSRFDPPANIKYIKHLKQTVVFRLLLAINLWMLG